MRLDEWQQFIESQFLDDPVVEAKPESGREAAEEAPVEEPVVELHIEPPAPQQAPEEKSPAPVVIVSPPVAVQAPPPSPRTEYAELTADLPDFASYIKPARIREVKPPADPSPKSKQTATKPAPQPRERRKARTHARHARNVAPPHVEPGLSATDLWQQVPRHIQTLLTLGREEEEVAQYSYKRPFAESRQELIARLIDPVLTLEETARLLNVCPTTVRRYTNRGILSHYRKETEAQGHESGEKETRQRRFRLSDILAFLEAQHSVSQVEEQPVSGATSGRKRAAPPPEQ